MRAALRDELIADMERIVVRLAAAPARAKERAAEYMGSTGSRAFELGWLQGEVVSCSEDLRRVVGAMRPRPSARTRVNR